MENVSQRVQRDAYPKNVSQHASSKHIRLSPKMHIETQHSFFYSKTRLMQGMRIG